MTSHAVHAIANFRWRVLALMMMVATTESSSQVAAGRAVATVPHLVGLTVDSATKLLSRLDLSKAPSRRIAADQNLDNLDVCAHERVLTTFPGKS